MAMITSELAQEFIAALRASVDSQVAVAHPRRFQRVAWTDLRQLSTAEPAEIDAWFLAFETRLQSTGVTPDKYVEKFVECPSVPEHLKSRVRDNESGELSYTDLRRKILEEFGPVEPVAFFKRKLHHLRCATAAEAKQQISTLLELHNRAAVDHEEGKLKDHSLCYCFMDALPTQLRQHLEANYAIAAAMPQPLEQLFKMANAKAATEDPLPVFLASPGESDRKRPRTSKLSPPTPTDDSLASALALIAQRLPGPSRFVSGPRSMSGPCSGCGGNCEKRHSCPARGKECFRCHRQGHFGSVCRSGASAGVQQSSANSAPIRSFRRAPPTQPPR